jgi:hypothetical protein
MNTLLIIIIILIIVLFIYNSSELFENNNNIDNYYIDSNGLKHIIKTAPMKLTNILELKFSTKEALNVKFITTKGSYNNLSTENEFTSVNGEQTMYKSIHIKNNIPFSGILF